VRAGKTAVHRQVIIEAARAADPSLSATVIAAVVDAILTTPAAARELAAALAEDPNALITGAPASAGRLITALRERGSRLPEPACASCGSTGKPLIRSPTGGVCRRCWDHQQATACARCGVVKLVRGRDEHHRPLCGACSDRPQRRCGRCGRTRRIARRGRDGRPDICDACYRLPIATCSRCGRQRPCIDAAGAEPICLACTPRRSVVCAHCGQQRPPTARWPEGPICEPCYRATLQRRGACTGCGQTRRLVDPPGTTATRCADCAGQPITHACTDCGTEDRLYEHGRCNRCALRRRTQQLLAAGQGEIPAALAPVYEAIISTATPRSALNWLRNGAGAKLLADLAAGELNCSHEALDAHPRRQAADYLRHILIANDVLPARDETLASVERFLADTLAGLPRDHDCRLIHTYATWRVLRRLRRSAERAGRPRSYTRHARANITAAVAFLNWIADRGLTLAEVGQGDADTWLAGGPARYQVRDFLQWAATAGHARAIIVPNLASRTGPADSDEQRWAQVRRLLHDDTLELTDRVAGTLLLLFGQQLSRIAAMTTNQVITRADKVFLRVGRDDLHIHEPLASLLLTLVRQRRRYLGVGTPAAANRWLFPGLQPGRPLTAARLGERLRALGIRAQPGRRSAMTHLAAQVPSAVLADMLNLAPTTAVKWVSDAGGDWSRYAAELAREANHQP
jgi:hypothetical protein